MTLTEFLHAMIDGDERIARQTDPNGPEYDDAEWDVQAVAEVLWDTQPHAKRCGWRMGEGLDRTCTCDYPARVLAECEAKRRIVEEHASIDAGQWGVACGRCADWISPKSSYPEANTVDFPCATLRFLALPYATHPDYDKAWRP